MRLPREHDIWKEVDKRFVRYIRVLRIENDLVYIKNIRKTRASIKRFNGKTNGYIYIKNDVLGD